MAAFRLSESGLAVLDTLTSNIHAKTYRWLKGR
jgi:hypothetical protein